MSKSISEWAREVYQNAVDKGWHDEDANLSQRDLIGGWVSNLHGEVSEFWEAFRDGKLHKPCDKAERMAAAGLAPLTCAEEELADVVIRAFDDAQALGIDIERAIALKHAYNKTRPHRHGGKLA